jgi:hypothetical protein
MHRTRPRCEQRSDPQDRAGFATDVRLRQLDRELAELARTLAGSIRREEGIGGFFAFLCTAAPRYIAFIESLRAEHTRLLNAIAALRAKVVRADSPVPPSGGAASDAMWRRWRRAERHAAFRAEADAIIDAIADHEALEREVLRDALDPF